MPRIISDAIDAYPFRKVNARVQFLVLRRRDDDPVGGRWQAVHGKIRPGENTVTTVRREIADHTGLTVSKLYTADFIAQFFDVTTDSLVLVPSFAAQVAVRAKPEIAAEFIDYAWCDLEETTARLATSSQRWAVRHIYDVIALGGAESDQYEIV
jgi:dATP pyrophosphohydrolase